MRRVVLFILLMIVIIPSLQAKTILVVGDSLSAGYGIDPQQGWVNLLQQRLKQQRLDYQVVNISTSGDTTSNGLSKLPQALTSYQPSIVMIVLGANDGLRGLTIAQMKSNLATMIQLSQQDKAKVLLVATRLPPNYGPSYLQQHADVFKQLAKQYQIPLVPMLLKGVAARPGLVQADGLHPTTQAQPQMLDNVWPSLHKLLKD